MDFMSVKINPDPANRHALLFTGTPRQLADAVDETMADDPSGDLYVNGLFVSKATRGGQHNGQPAITFTLTMDATISTEVGRLVLVDTDEWRENIPEWTVWFADDDEALENYEILTARAKMPRVSSITIDYLNIDETIEEALAEVAARFGVTGTVVDPHGPGGGAPVVEFKGLTEKLEKFLRSNEPYGYGFDDGDMKEFFYKS